MARGERRGNREAKKPKQPKAKDVITAFTSTKEEIVMKNLTPRHIEKDESDRLGIKHGWYGIKVNGTLMTGPAPSHADCLKLIDALPDVPDRPSSAPGQS